MILEDIEIFLCLPSPSNQAQEGQRKEEVKLGKGRKKKETGRRRRNEEEKKAKRSFWKKRVKRMKGKTRVCFDEGTLVMELKEVEKEGDRLDMFDGRTMSGRRKWEVSGGRRKFGKTEGTMVLGSATCRGH